MRTDASDDRLPYRIRVAFGREVLAVGGCAADTAPVVVPQGGTVRIEARGTSGGTGEEGEAGQRAYGGTRVEDVGIVENAIDMPGIC